MDLFSDISRALEQGFQNSVTFLETNSALLANTLALDKLSEFDGLEVRSTLPATFARTHFPCGTPDAGLRSGWASVLTLGGRLMHSTRSPSRSFTAKTLRFWSL
jgi:hypothetical protein